MPGPLRRLVPAALALGLLPVLAAAQPIAIVGGEVHTGTGEVLAGATVLIEDGKITAIGPGVELPEGAEVISAEGMVVTPGLIDAQTLLGTSPGEGGGLVSLGGDPDAAIVPQMRAADRFAENLAPLWLQSGVTSAYLAPDPRLLIGGTGAVVKLSGPAETALLAEEVAVAASFGESAVGDSPPGREAPRGRTTRQGMIYDLRNTLIRAGEDAFEGEAGRTLGRLLSGEIPLRMLANKPDDIETALRVAAEFEVRLVSWIRLPAPRPWHCGSPRLESRWWSALRSSGSVTEARWNSRATRPPRQESSMPRA